jgi:AcrR family transcriptional regulator
MGGEKDGKEKWVSAGLATLAEGGIDQVRVEVVAERLGVTKGGFYRRFRDRRALLDAMLEEWSHGRVDVVHRQTELGDLAPKERLKALIDLYAGRPNAHGMAIELAIRQWAKSDKAAAAAVALVDAQRLKSVETLYRRLGLAADEAKSMAVLFYSFIFGQSLLFLETAPRKRAGLIMACTDALTNVGKDVRRQ